MRNSAAACLSFTTVLVLLVTAAPPPMALAEPAIPREPFTGVLPAWAMSLAAPASPQSLPLPYLSDADVADAPYGASPAVDGRIGPGEYAGAGRVTFPGRGGDVEAFFREDGAYLYVAFDLPALQLGIANSADVYLDTDLDGDGNPDAMDYWLRIATDGIAPGPTLEERQGGTGGWGPPAPLSGWTAAAWTGLTGGGWQAEFRIDYAKLGLTPGTFQVLGLALAAEDGGLFYWPPGADRDQPDTWGSLVSSSDWGTFYWKPGPWEDYAPSGMPDFDQTQVIAPTYCGPFAAANSIWWFDSKFEQNPVGPTGGPPATLPISDSYTLVSPYGIWDDHDPRNVSSLALDLAGYFGTDKFAPGTRIYDMYYGIQRYLRDHFLWDDYVVTLVDHPDFYWIAEEVMRSEDVILLLGFWEYLDGFGWVRYGGHYVTVAGVDPQGLQIAFSDPAQDLAEVSGAGRVFSGTLITHYPPHPSTVDPLIHNDAGNVSHDIHAVSSGSASPGGDWWLPTYEPPLEFLAGMPPGMNPNPRWEEPPPFWEGGPIHTEIEYALAVSPYTWKASGRWVEDEEVELYGCRFDPYDDFAPSGVPDFDQKQDNWGRPSAAFGWQWSFCGPVAAANSLWWFDSKFEYGGAVPPTISDTYPLVWSYNPGGWDDHDPLNVDDPATPWPPVGWPAPPPIAPGQGELVEDLALYFLTDQPPLGSGTAITDVYVGLNQYTIDHNLRQGYVITQVQRPEFWWVAEEVERSEDVLLLLGFYALVDPGPSPVFERVGGHYVTVAGVDKTGSFVGFSDPYWDRMETKLPPNEFSGYPWWTGRVGSDGDPPLGPSGLVPTYTHPPLPHPGVYTLHNDAANVSHDVYRVVTSTSPGGVWGPEVYVESTLGITSFVGVNGPGGWVDPSAPIQTEVEWAVAVSPVADVWITKTVTPTVVMPGDWVTFTIVFSNAGNTADDVVVSDLLSDDLINPSVVGTWNSYGGNIVTHDTFTWTVGSVPWQGWGIITVTAQVDPTSDWPSEEVITNVVSITTTTQEQYQLPSMADTASATFTVQTADVTVRKAAAPATLVPGDSITFTLVYTNSGPGTAANSAISDLLPVELTGVGYSASNDYGAAIGHSGSYLWQLGNIPAGGGGTITVTGEVDSSISWQDAQRVITNSAVISTTSVEPTTPAPLSNQSSATFTVQTSDLIITKMASPSGTLSSYDWVTFTIVYSNAGPGPANSVVITDLLSGMLITSTVDYTYTTSYMGALSDSDYYVWQAGTVPPLGWGTITVTGQISLALGASLPNEAWIEGVYDRVSRNNRAAVAVPLSGGSIYLPLVLRNY
jgi:uncharacterized repeat protein (TIGR01451 family)